MDREELAALVRAHQAQIFRYVRYLGANASDAEDIVQETFLAAFRNTKAPDAADARLMAAWLRGIARNLFLRHCRKTRTDHVRADSQLLERAEAAWTAEFLREGDGFDYVEAMRHCVGKLSDRQRRAIELRYAEKKSRSEMARLLDMTDNGVKSLLRRIRAGLAECVHRRLSLESG